MAPFARTVAILIVLQTGTVVFGSLCSEPNRTSNLTACLERIANLLIDDTTSFWFGENYTQRCPNGEADGLICTNPKPIAKSMALRIFSTTNALSKINIDRFLELHFESTGRNYNACDNTFKDPETDVWRMDTDPTSDTVVYPWFVKNFPITVQWTYTAGDFFTLVVYDVGYLIPHAVFINIQGDDITTREELKAYHGPLMANDLENPYIFMLFKQDGHINVSQDWKDKIATTQWTIDAFITAYNMTGPIAANWIVATGDEWAAQTMLDNHYTAMCTVFATRALHKLKPRSFIPADTALTVWIHFEFSTEGYHTTACCNTYTYNAHNFTINPLGDPGYNTWEIRDESEHKVTFLKEGQYAHATNFTDDMYMIVALDPDVAYAHAGTEDKPILHGLITNIMNGSLKTGDEGLSWIGPRPPDDVVHYYYTLLYKQESTLNASNVISTYTGSSCVARLVGRCLFDINLLVSEHNLTLVGATWMASRKDGYVLKRLLVDGDESDVCEGQPGYKNPCTTAGTAAIIPSICTLYVVFLLSLF